MTAPKGNGNWWHLLLSPLHPVLGPVLRASFLSVPAGPRHLVFLAHSGAS